MKELKIFNEFDTLRSVVVCYGKSVPNYLEYSTNDPEFIKFHKNSWDKELLLLQQENFFNLLIKYDVELIFPNTKANLLWQMYTRDTAFVIKDKLYYSSKRKLGPRSGEIDELLKVLEVQKENLVTITSEIEGGDVIINEIGTAYVGISSRTTKSSAQFLESKIKTKIYNLGDQVMHLDTRLTLISPNVALVNIESFNKNDFESLRKKYQIIEVTEEETRKLGTNVFSINPETVVVPTQHKRVGEKIKEKGFKVEYIDYTEPINLGGSFRCTTLPIRREN